MNSPQLTYCSVPAQPVLCHMEDPKSPSFWNTPFRVKINLRGRVLDATLDTGASLSAVQADIVQNHNGLKLGFNHVPLPLYNWQMVEHASQWGLHGWLLASWDSVFITGLLLSHAFPQHWSLGWTLCCVLPLPFMSHLELSSWAKILYTWRNEMAEQGMSLMTGCCSWKFHLKHSKKKLRKRV